MKRWTPISEKNKKNIINLSSAEFAQRVLGLSNLISNSSNILELETLEYIGEEIRLTSTAEQ